MAIRRSPGGPPLMPALPFALIDNCMPSSTPAGISISIVSSSITLPSPLHLVQGSITIEPDPWQLGHCAVVCIWPRKVLLTCLTPPAPPQVVQFLTAPSLAPLPLHVWHFTRFLTLIVFLTPVSTSSKVRLSLILRLLPFCPWERC